MPMVSVLPSEKAQPTSWAFPPVDGSLTVPEIFDWNYEHNPQHPLFVHPKGNGQLEYTTMKQAVQAMHRVSHRYTSYLTAQGHAPSERDAPVVAIFGLTDTITYICTWMGLARAGYTVFHISPRNSAAALAHLFRHRSVVHILTSSEPGIKETVRTALATIDDNQEQWESIVSDMPTSEFLFKTAFEVPLMPKRVFHSDAIICYIHSSGTTNFPKPVPWTNDAYIWARHVYEGAHDYRGQVLAVQSIPMFHGLGMMSVLMAARSGVTFSTFEPRIPATPVSADSVWAAAMLTRANYIFVVPSVIEAWSREPAKVNALKNTKGLLYGGGPLSTAVGDYLTQEGVNVYITYGASEIGMYAPILPAPPGKDWEYFEILPSIHVEFVDHGNGTFEPIVVTCATHSPRLINSKWNGKDAYATSDLLMPHPTKEGFWRIFGRADDQIMLSNGEKTNPGPLEDILCQDPRIQAAVMFGRGRLQNGVLLQPKQEFVFDPSNNEELAKFRRLIWPAVEKMNEYAPQHSRLFKEMILVTCDEKPFLYTSKGSIRRSATLDLYEEEIHALHNAVAETTQEDILAPSDWSLDTALPFVRRVVSSVMKAHLTDDDDFFQHGCDSLQATWIRNSIARALRHSTSGTLKVVPDGVVYAHPTIASLVTFCTSRNTSETSDAVEQDEKRKAMLALVSKYTQDIPSFKPSSSAERPSDQAVVVVTGTTGSLGSNLLEALILSSAVAKIYALNRPSTSGDSLATRQRRSFTERGLDDTLLDSEKVVLLEADLCEPDLSLREEVLEEMRSSVTGIIHNAWRVDFNLALSSFEPSIKAIRILMDFALSTKLAKPPRLVFTSSVSVLRNAVRDGPIDESEFEDPAVAIGSGYSEGKWVAERILARASATSPSLETISVRVGQLAGGTGGAWNASEWFPALVRSGRILDCLPTQEAEVAWVPVHAAAAALLEMTFAPTAPGTLHLAHPRPVSWSSIIGIVARELAVPLAPYTDWLRALEDSVQDRSRSEVEHMRTNPALRLLSFFKSIPISSAPSGREAMGMPLMDTTQAQVAAPSLKTLAPLSEAEVMSWLAFWRTTGSL